MTKKLWLACIGGYSYFLLELIYNGNSSWFSFVLGGICFTIIGKIRLFNLNNIYKCIISGIMITGKSNYGWYSIVAVYCSTVFGLKGIKTHKKLDLFCGIIWAIASVIMIYSYFKELINTSIIR